MSRRFPFIHIQHSSHANGILENKKIDFEKYMGNWLLSD
jgi:hypothetical protein